jgi:hypothetical protein
MRWSTVLSLTLQLVFPAVPMLTPGGIRWQLKYSVMSEK